MVVCFNVQKNNLIAIYLLRVFLNETGFKTIAVHDGEEYNVAYWSTPSGWEAIPYLCHDARSCTHLGSWVINAPDSTAEKANTIITL